jgi:hypothetical protein
MPEIKALKLAHKPSTNSAKDGKIMLMSVDQMSNGEQ